MGRVSIKRLLGALLLSASCHGFADCQTSLPLDGVVSIKDCDPKAVTCISATKALYEYMAKSKDAPEVLSLALHGNPWRFYDQDMRILEVEEVAELIRPLLNKRVKRVDLVASWSGVAPDTQGKSLARKLSEALRGFPVEGKEGFLWINRKGQLRTTRQAFTLMKGGKPYSVTVGDEVMMSLAGGWPATMEDLYIRERDAEGILRAGAGWDIFMLCPERALQAFEAAAKFSHPVAAYNAALLRLERGEAGDREAAVILLNQAADAGDKKAWAKLGKLGRH